MADETDTKTSDTETATNDALALSGAGGLEPVAPAGVNLDEAPPAQLGVQRFVYAAYMAAAVLVAFFVTKIIDTAWFYLAQWKPAFGDPREEMVYVLSALVGVALAVFYWRKAAVRSYVEDVAAELSKVTWPDKKEITRSTLVVVVTTIVATLFFSMLDQFWRFVTDKVYGF